MRYTQAQVATRINRLAAIKSQQRRLEARANDLVLAIRAAGGGQSKKWDALLVRMPRKVVVVKAHTQVRLYARHR